MNALGKLAIPGLRGVWRDDAMLNATLRALCVPPENGVREQKKGKASIQLAIQPFSVARWALWKGGGGQLPHGVWVPFGAARSNEHRHTRARKFRHDPSETHPQEQRGEGFTQRESWGGRLDVDKTSAPPQKFFRRCVRCLDCSGHLPGTAPYVAISSVLKTLVGTTDLVPFPMLPPIGPGLPDQ